MARWWNDTPQFDGLYDNQGRVRPAYHAFKLLSFLKGTKLPVSGANRDIKAFAVRNGNEVHTVIWNFPARANREPVEVNLAFDGSVAGRFRLSRLSADAALSQLELETRGEFAKTEQKNVQFTLRPYEICWFVITP